MLTVRIRGAAARGQSGVGGWGWLTALCPGHTYRGLHHTHSYQPLPTPSHQYSKQMGSQSKLQDDLQVSRVAINTLCSFVYLFVSCGLHWQAEFSPQLDASLIAAIVADYVSDGDRNPSKDVVQQLRNQLSQLAAQAEQDEHALSEQLAHISFDTGNSITDDTNSLNDTSTTETTTACTTPSSCGGSDASSSSPRSFSSPLGFLQAAFPYMPISTLRNALGSMGDIDDVDMEAVVVSILSKEYIRELEERGLEEDGAADEGEVAWQTVDKKKTTPPKQSKKQKKPTVTLTFGDVRQQTQVRTSSTPNSQRPNMSQADPWTQVSSMAAHLSDLLPSYPPSFFQSIFHSPKYASPSTALRATLDSSTPTDIPALQMEILYGLFEVLTSSDAYDGLSETERNALLSDAQLAFRATKFDPEAALSLLEVLQSLDSDSVSGEWGLFHSPVPASPVSPTPAAQPKSPTLRSLPSGPPAIPPPPARQRSFPLSLNAWQTVPPARKSASTNGYSHADFIPAYNTGKKAKMRGAGNGMGKGGKGDVGELGGRKGYTGRASELTKKRNEALREASRAWQRGNNKTRGGEIAQFYAAKVS